jgi:hypothetical protein
MGDEVANVVLIEAWPEHWPVWVKEASAEMEKVEKVSLNWIPINSRRWVLNVFSQIIRSAWPKLAFSDPNDAGPFILGQFVGHQLEGIHICFNYGYPVHMMHSSKRVLEVEKISVRRRGWPAQAEWTG